MSISVTVDSLDWMQVEEYSDLLSTVLLKREDGLRIMPELYTVVPEKVSPHCSFLPVVSLLVSQLAS